MSKLYTEIYKLKTILRKGWLMRNVGDYARVESDAEHTFSMTILALEIITKESLKLNQEKVLKMILFHELGEIDYGDHTPHEHIPSAVKHENEQKCVERLAKECGMPEILSIWQEYEEGKTMEAQFVKKIDKLDAVMQSKVYSNISGNQDLFDEFKTNSLKIADEFKKYVED